MSSTPDSFSDDSFHLDELDEVAKSAESNADKAASTTSSVETDVAPERIRQIHTVCRLLEVEGRPESHRIRKGQVGRFRLDAFARVVLAAAVLIAAGFTAVLNSVTRPAALPVVDYRIGPRYTDHEAGDILLPPDSTQLLIGTQGGGVHRVDTKTRFLRQLTMATTQGGLLSDDIQRMNQDAAGRPYFLCREKDFLGLCRADAGLSNWKTLIGFDRFAALDVESPLSQVSAVTESGGRVWVGTHQGGAAAYSLSTHTWEYMLTSRSQPALPDDRIRDLATDGQGRVWIATAGGLSRFEPKSGQCESFSVQTGLAGTDVTHLSVAGDELWYVTAGGGLGHFDGAAWSVLAPESGWKNLQSENVALTVHGSDADSAWFVGQQGEVARYSLAGRRWDLLPDLPDSPAVTGAVTTDRGVERLWLGTPRGLLTPSQPDSQGETQWKTILPFPVDHLDGRGDRLIVQEASGNGGTGRILVNTSGKNWRTAAGSGKADIGSQGILSAARDSQSGHLWIGTEKGISVYDPVQHEWIGNFPNTGSKSPQGSVTDVCADNGQVVLLTESHQIGRFDVAEGSYQMLLGGGRFPATQQDVTAVTRDSSGQLWLGTAQAGLHRYDTVRHRWNLVALQKNITQLAATEDSVWAVGDGKLFRASPDGKLFSVKATLPPLRMIRGSLESPGVLAIGEAGEVVYLTSADEAEFLVGTAAAPGFDPASAGTVGVLGPLVAFGGAQPHLYNSETRSWTALKTGPVDQIVESLGHLWLNANGSLFRASPDEQVTKFETDTPVRQLAATANRLVLLGDDYRIQYRSQANGGWQLLKPPASGPDLVAITSQNLAVAAGGDDLYLAGGNQGRGWHFSWRSQTWTPLMSEAGPITDVDQLAADSSRVYVVQSGGTLLSGLIGQARLQKVTGGIRQIRTHQALATATTETGRVVTHDNKVWTAVAGVPATRPLGELKQAVSVSDGFVIAGERSAAWLSSGLTDWHSLPGPAGDLPLTKLFRGQSDTVWALNRQNSLYVRQNQKWAPVTFPVNAAVSAATVVPSADDQTPDELWTCLSDGSVFRVTAAGAREWSRFTRSPAKPQEIVGISSTADGFLVAFRRGILATFRFPDRQWREEESPVSEAFQKLLTADENPAAGFSLLLAADGSLWRTRRNGALNWEQVGVAMAAVTVSGAEAFAITRSGSVLQIPAAGDAKALVTTGPAPSADLGLPLTASEISRPGSAPVLVLAFRDTLATYDPVTRSWESRKGAVAHAWPVANGVLIQSTQGSLARLSWDDSLTVTTLPLPAPARTAATSPGEKRALAATEDGQVLLLTPDVQPEALIGKALPAQVTSRRILEVQAIDARLYLADSGGQLHCYYLPDRAWSTLDLAKVSRMLVRNSALYVEAASAKGPGRTLYRVNVVKGQLNTTLVKSDVLTWDSSPSGIIIESGNTKAVSRTRIADTGQVTTFPSVPAPGPPERSVSGVRLTGSRLWLREDSPSSRALWNYHLTDRNWIRVSGADDRLASVCLSEGRATFLTEAGKLTSAVPLPNQKWNLRDLSQSVTGFDADDSSVVWTTADSVVRFSFDDARESARKAFGGRAWTQPVNQIRAAAAQGHELLVSNQDGDLAVYDLSRREWSRLASPGFIPQRLKAVGDRWFAVGAKGALARSDDGKWTDVSQRSTSQWQSAKHHYSISAGNRWMIGEVGQTPTADSRTTAPKPIAGSPVRLEESTGAVWIEFSDGALRSYDIDARMLKTAIAPQETASRPAGLVRSDQVAVFVDDVRQQVWRLPTEEKQLTQIELPDKFQIDRDRLRVLPEGVFVAQSDDSALLITESAVRTLSDSAEISALQEKGKSPAADRSRTGKRWRIPSVDSGKPAVLQFLAGESWKPVPMDSRRAELAWDIVFGGLNVRDQSILLTSSGVVIRAADGTGLPVDYFPIDWQGASPDASLLFEEAGRMILLTSDGRAFRLPETPEKGKPLEALAVPESRWEIDSSQDGWSFLAEFAGQKLPVSLDAAGRFGFDLARSVSLMGKSVFVATRDGLFEYSTDFDRLMGIPLKGTCDVLTSADRKFAYAQLADQSVFRLDGEKWVASEQSWSRLSRVALMTDRDREQPLALPLPLAGGQTKAQAVYAGNRLDIDEPVPRRDLPLLTHDGRNTITLTLAGLVIRDEAGQLVAVHRVSGADGLLWTQDEDGKAALLIRGPDKSGWQMAGTRLQPVDSYPEALRPPTVVWRGTTVVRKQDDSGSLIMLQADSLREVIDLRQRGFLHDTVSAVGLDRQSAWLISTAGIERLSLQDRTRSERFEFPAEWTGGDVSIHWLDNRLLVQADADNTIALKSDGTIQSVRLTPEDLTALQRLYHGDRWRVDRAVPETASRKAISTISFQNDDGVWISAPYQAGAGFSWDRPQAVGATSEHVVLSTASGDLLARRTPQGTRLTLPALTPISNSEDGVAAELWTDRAGSLWRRTDAKPQAKWSLLDLSGWKTVNQLPQKLLEERATLSRSGTAYWRTEETGVSFVEFDSDGTSVPSVMQADGTLPVLSVEAAVRHDASIWLLTQQDLREIDAQTHKLIQTTPRPEGSRAEFLLDRSGLFLHLRTSPSEPPTVLQRIQRRWKPADFNPLTRPDVAQSGLLRLTHQQGRLVAHLREQPDDGDWHPVTFSTASNLFDFQVSLDAVATTGHLLSRSSGGIATWTRRNNDWELTAFRPDLEELRLPSSGRLLASRKPGGVEEFQNAKWQATTLTASEANTLAASPIWRVVSQGKGAVIHATSSKAPSTVLSTSSEGGFDYQRPNRIALESDGAVWSGNSKSVVRYEAARAMPGAVWPDDGSELVRIQDRIYAGANQQLRAYDPAEGRWNAVEDSVAVMQQRSVLFEGTQWKWQKDGTGKISGTIQTGNRTAAAQFDGEARRFEFDVIQDVGLLERHAWLSHAAGFSQIDLKTRQLVRFESSPGRQPVRYDRVHRRLLTGSKAAGYWNLATDEVTTVPASPELESLFAVKYSDQEWQWSSSGIRWRETDTKLTEGQFAHDRFQAMTTANGQMLVTTPTGLLTWQLEDDGELADERLLTGPPQAAVGLQVEQNLIHALTENGGVFSAGFDPAAPGSLEWTPQDPASVSLTLISSPEWTWTRHRDHSIHVFVGREKTELSPLISATGKFCFDEVASVLATEDGLILAGQHGLALQNFDDGRIARWLSCTDSGMPPIRRLVRVDTKGWPVPSWSAPTNDESEILAIGTDASVWKADRKEGPWIWERSESVPSLSRILQVGMVEVRREAGQLKLQYREHPDGQDVLVNGRFTTDVMSSVLRDSDGLWLGTRAGLTHSVVAGPEAASDTKLIPVASDGASLVGISRLFHRMQDDALCLVTGTGQIYQQGELPDQWTETDDADSDTRVNSRFWTWSHHPDGFRVSLHQAGSAIGEWPLFEKGRFSFDVLRSFRIEQDSLLAVTAGGLVEYDLESMETKWIHRSAIDDDTGQEVPFTDVRRFAGDGSPVCYSDTHSYRREKRLWHRKLGAEQLGEQIWKTGDVQWQLVPRTESAGFGFDVLLQNSKGQLLRQYTVLPGVPENRLKRVIAEPERLWICLDRGLYFLNRD